MASNYISLLKEIIKQGELTQIQLAARLGVTFAALNRWINGHARPRAPKITAIQKLFQELVGFPSLSATDIEGKIKEADSFKKKKLWDLVAHRKDLQNDLLLEHTYNSTAIEGTTFTKRETESVIFQKAFVPDKTLVEHLEVTNHAHVLRRIFNKELTGPLTEKLIREIHQQLMQGIREDAGHYSKHKRALRGVNIHLTHPEDIPEEMGSLIRVWNRKKHERTVKEIADFHIQFELIHPFGDGNGRVGRLLMVTQCLQEGFPPVIIENARKAEYYDVLEYAQRKTDEPFILFLIDEMEKTLSLIKKYR